MINNDKEIKKFFDGILYQHELNTDLITSALTKASDYYVESREEPTYEGFQDFIQGDESPIIYMEMELQINKNDEWQLLRPSIDEWLDTYFPKEWQDNMWEVLRDAFDYSYGSAEENRIYQDEINRGDHDPKTL